MVKNKLITLLRTFSKEEMKDFGRFISSSFFSTGRNLKPLYILLNKFHSQYNSPAFTQEKIFQRLYPGRKFDGKKSLHAIHVHFSDMFILAEKFMVYNEVQRGNNRYAYYEKLSSAYQNRNLHEHALKAILTCEGIIDNAQDEYLIVHKKIEFLQSISGFFFYKNLPKKGYEYSEKMLLFAIADFIRVLGRFTDNYFLFKNTFNLSSNAIDVVKKFLNAIDPLVFEDIAEHEMHTINITRINYYQLQSVINNDDKNYLNEAVKIYLKVIHNLSNTDKLNLFFMIFSRQCSILKNEISYIAEADKFFELVASNHIFNPGSKNNLVASFYEAELKIKTALYNYKKIKIYVNKFLKFVESDKADGMTALSNCFICLKQKKFIDCLKLLSNKSSLNGIGQNDYYRLKTMCLYELNDHDGLISTLNSFEKYSRKNKIVSENSKRENLNFIKAVKLLIILKIDYDNAEEAKRVTELIKNNIFYWWFKEKLEEL